MKSSRLVIPHFPFASWIFPALLLFGMSQMIGASVPLDSLSNLAYEATLNDIWGYADENGKEYALVGLVTGVSIVDVSEPTAPVELFFIEEPQSTWRDLKTWEDHAYVSNEEDGGILIIDLGNLPQSIDTTRFHADSLLQTAHNLYVDEGVLYVAGYNSYNENVSVNDRGVVMLDVATNPWQPTVLGIYNDFYAHDVYVRDHVMYTSDIYEGELGIIDITDLNNPISLGRTETTTSFTHNAWLSDDSQYVFTTDEKNNANVDAYDISDVTDIRFLDSYKAAKGSNAIPHNVHVVNDFLVISYYTEGVRVVDANDPEALVETEFFDTSEFADASFKGCWGAYPFLPSGIILASDRQRGLFVLQPQYQRASYASGTVTDAETGMPLGGVQVQVVNNENDALTDIQGKFKTGTSTAGSYDFSFYKYGYQATTVNSIPLNEAETTDFEIAMQPLTPFDLTINVVDDLGNPISGASVEVRHPNVNLTLVIDENGESILPEFFTDNYILVSYKWGYKTSLQENITISSNETNTFTIVLERGYYDDFFLDFDWNVASFPDDEGEELGGAWTRGKPKQTFVNGVQCNPQVDVQSDLGNQCYVTGNGNFNVEDFDLENGTTILSSPIFDVTDYNLPSLDCFVWFCTDGNEEDADYLQVKITNGTDTVQVLQLDATSENLSQWYPLQVALPTVIDITSEMQVILEASASTSGLTIEAALDVFQVTDGLGIGIESDNITRQAAFEASISPNPITDERSLQIAISTNEAIGNTEQPMHLILFDLQGQMVLKKQISLGTFGNEQRVNVALKEGLSNGMYFLQLGNPQLGFQVQKLVKQ